MAITLGAVLLAMKLVTTLETTVAATLGSKNWISIGDNSVSGNFNIARNEHCVDYDVNTSKVSRFSSSHRTGSGISGNTGNVFGSDNFDDSSCSFITEKLVTR